MHARASFTLLAAVALCGAPLRAQDLSGAWTVRGRDAVGPYRGTASLTGAENGAVHGALDLERLRVGPRGEATPTGRRLRARLDGRLEAGTLRVTRAVDGGLAGALGGGMSVSSSVAYALVEAGPPGRRQRRLIGAHEVLFAVAPGAPAADEDRPGDWGAPLSIPATPFDHAGTTVGRRSQAQRYAPRPQVSEGGPEVVYRLDVPVAARLVASLELEGDRDPVDVDVQVLRSLALDAAGTATDGLARDDHRVEVEVEAGTVYVVVDTFQSARRAGPYRLHVDLVPRDGWRERAIAAGVTLRTRVYPDLLGGRQTASELQVDLAAPGVAVRPIMGQGCATTSVQAERAGCVAAVNGGFFGDGCRSVSLCRVDGALLSTNAKDRSAIGFDAAGRPSIALVPAGHDWPEARQALGGVQRLLRGGAVVAAPGAEDSAPAFSIGANPRTGVGITARGGLVLATIDGRTPAGAGMRLADFAAWLRDEGAVDALNLDGGGSTTLWVRGEGVINYPSDDHRADHEGERPVSTILGVWAPPLDRDAMWLAPPTPSDLAPGQAWAEEVVVADPEGARVALRLEGPVPAGLVLEDRGDGTARLSWVAAWPASATSLDLRLVAMVADGRPASRAFSLRRR